MSHTAKGSGKNFGNAEERCSHLIFQNKRESARHNASDSLNGDALKNKEKVLTTITHSALMLQKKRKSMQIYRDFDLILKRLVWIAVLFLLLMVSTGGQLPESQSFFNFIKAVDPENVLRIDRNGLLAQPCLHKLKGVKCNSQATAIVEIRLESLNLGGILDAEALCKLPNLRVLSLAKNHIRGNIPSSILYCRKLTYLNLSNNLLSGRLPLGLTRLKYLSTLDISNNHFTSILPYFKQELKNLSICSLESSAFHKTSAGDRVGATDSVNPPSESPGNPKGNNVSPAGILMILGLVVGGLSLLAFLYKKRTADLAKKREIPERLQKSPPKTPPPEAEDEVKPVGRSSELVLFVEKHERFKLEDLLEATADLQSQTLCSALYKVVLKNHALFAVTRLKTLQVSFEEFGQTMRRIGNLKHPNILPLIGYHSTDQEKLLIFKYQSNGSLLNLLEDYIDGKRDFPWGLRLSIARGIANGLASIHQNSGDEGKMIPHGNLKLSNIFLDENNVPLISEYGFSRLLYSTKLRDLSSTSYTAPEKSLSEQGDVFSFGVILLELLTGKTVEKSRIDLPKWVRAMVREEWTGEVFDKEVSKAASHSAFPLLNVALKCASESPESRPTMAEVLEKIEEIVATQGDRCISPPSCFNPHTHDLSVLHSIIPDTWDSPGSNY